MVQKVSDVQMVQSDKARLERLEPLERFEPSVASAKGEGKARSVYEDLVAVLFLA